jgi:hypothetical protein
LRQEQALRKIGSPYIGISQIRPNHIGTAQVRSPQIRSDQVSAS